MSCGREKLIRRKAGSGLPGEPAGRRGIAAAVNKAAKWVENCGQSVKSRGGKRKYAVPEPADMLILSLKP